ncbi:hypothetical protein G5I_12721 [Acromyrmex echinatior]|uniref:Uncharacterized protein n=1 Tax=Acromyrmex echinatior TaxID=103372 RepID=F4X330_ACREC|nr:hypothetical protein G5I_12721 [Acromyrmex echinatior]
MRGCVCGLVVVFVEGGDYALVAGKVAGKAEKMVVKEASDRDESAEDTSRSDGTREVKVLRGREGQLGTSRVTRDALGTTGSAVAMPLPAERNRYTDRVKKDRMIQVYGFNAELYHNMSEAQHKSQGLVAISLMVQLGETLNPELQIITSVFNKVIYRVYEERGAESGMQFRVANTLGTPGKFWMES